MTCKLCGAESGGAAPCPSCGFDSSLDYEQYPTLATIDTAPSLSAQKREQLDRLSTDRNSLSGTLAALGGALQKLEQLDSLPADKQAELSALVSRYESLFARVAPKLQEVEQWLQPAEPENAEPAEPEKADAPRTIKGNRGGCSWVFDVDSGCLTVSGRGDMPDDLRPDHLDEWKELQSRVRSVVIQGGVTGISYYAFNNFRDLTSVTISDTVTSIGASAFEGCRSLGHIRLPDGLTEISSSLFTDCTSLRGVVIPDSVTEIGFQAFKGCLSLKELRFPKALRVIGSYAFGGCGSLREIRLPHGVTTLGSGVFSGCEALQSVELPDTVRIIGKHAFSWCKSLESFTVPKGVTGLPESVFFSCGKLKSVFLPGSVSSINRSAFECCDSLETIHYGGSPLRWRMLLLTQPKPELGFYDNPKTNLSRRIKSGKVRVIFGA